MTELMSTINKTTLQRFNGTDWDSIYFATSADIVSMGAGFKAAEDTTGFKIDDVIEASDTVAAIITRLVNRLATIDTNILPDLQSGNITAVDASKITGVIDRANLPADVAGKVVKVATADEKNALTKAQVNIGDTVKVAGGGIFQVTGYDAENGDAPQYEQLTDETSDVQWNRLKGTPTTLDGYGITDAIKASEKATAGGAEAAGKVAVADANGKLGFDITGDAATLGTHAADYFATAANLTTTNTNVKTNADAITAINESLAAFDASKITKGTLPLSVVPKAALERIFTVENKEALATITAEQVQDGDTVKIKDSEVDGKHVAGAMYLVSDSAKLGTADYMEGLVEYTAGTAAAVDWSGVNNKPTTLAGYGIADAVSSDLVTDTATAGKLLKLNADGKLDVDITGDAATVGGKAVNYFATAEALTALDTAQKATASTVAALAATVNGTPAGEGTEAVPGLVEKVAAVESKIGAADTEGTILHSIAQLQAGTSIQALDASKLTGTISRDRLPADIGGTVHSVADLDTAFTTLTAANTHAGDWVKTTDGKLYKVTNVEALNAADGYTLMVDVAAMSIAWDKITGTPNTLAGYGITDAVNTADVIVDGLSESADVGGKIVKINSTDKKLHVNIAGDAATVGGHAPEYFATQAALDALALQVPQLLNSVDELTNPKVGQMVMIPVSAGAGA